jgi:predicted homoserine dehydrogenase-like protein
MTPSRTLHRPFHLQQLEEKTQVAQTAIHGDMGSCPLTKAK